MKVNMHTECEGDVRVGHLMNGDTFRYESYLYMHFRPGCSGFTPHINNSMVCCLNLKSGTMRLLHEGQKVQQMKSTVEAYPKRCN